MSSSKLTSLEKSIEQKFHASIWIIVYKFLFGLFEVLTGIIIAFFGRQILRFYNVDLSHELSEDPHDLLARLSQGVIPGLFNHHTFIVFYLISLGIIKIAGAIGLIYKQNWGVDLLVGFTVLLLPFQTFDLILHPSIFSFVYLIVGIFIALYLVEFKPRAWVSRILNGIK